MTRQGIRLIDEQDPVQRRIDRRMRAHRRLPHVLRHEPPAIHLHHMPATQQTQRFVNASHQPCHRRLARARVAEEHAVQIRLHHRQILLPAQHLHPREIRGPVHLRLHRRHAHQRVQFLEDGRQILLAHPGIGRAHGEIHTVLPRDLGELRRDHRRAPPPGIRHLTVHVRQRQRERLQCLPDIFDRHRLPPQVQRMAREQPENLVQPVLVHRLQHSLHPLHRPAARLVEPLREDVRVPVARRVGRLDQRQTIFRPRRQPARADGQRAIRLQLRPVRRQPRPKREGQQPHKTVHPVDQVELLLAKAAHRHQRRREDLGAFHQQPQLQQAGQDGFLLRHIVVEDRAAPVRVPHQLQHLPRPRLGERLQPRRVIRREQRLRPVKLQHIVHRHAVQIRQFLAFESHRAARLGIAEQRHQHRAGQQLFMQRQLRADRLRHPRQSRRRLRDRLQLPRMPEKLLQPLAQFRVFRFRLAVRFHPELSPAQTGWQASSFPPEK